MSTPMSEERLRLVSNPPNVAVPSGSVDLYIRPSDRKLVREDPDGTITEVITDSSGTVVLVSGAEVSSPIYAARSQITSNLRDHTFYITPDAPESGWAFTMPGSDESRLGQIIRIYSTQSITGVTFPYGPGTPAFSIVGTAITEFSAGVLYTLQRVGTSSWLRLT